MRVIGIIPARYKSSRLVGKPLIKIKNKPLIQLTYEAVLNSNLFDLIFIATESKKIQEFTKTFGAKCIITSKNHTNGTERCAELIEKLQLDLDNQDVIINIQCDEPFIKKNHLQKIIHLFKNHIKIGTLISPIHEQEISDTSIVKIIKNKNGIAIDFKRDSSELKSGHKLYKHIGVYAYQKSTLLTIAKLNPTKRELEEKLEQLRWIEHGQSISCAIINENIKSINTKNDIKNLEKT